MIFLHSSDFARQLWEYLSTSFSAQSKSQLSVGPTAVMALMTFSYANEGGPAYAALLTFLAGWIQLFAGILNLGYKIQLGFHM